MRVLYHYPLHPGSRAVRLCFAEKKLKLREDIIDPWSPSDAFLELAVEGVPPVLTDLTPDGPVTIIGTQALCEYADEASTRNPLLPGDRVARAEVRRLCAWMNERFDTEVNARLLSEKLETTRMGGTPDTAFLREGRAHLRAHLEYLNWLLQNRDGLAGPAFTLADIMAAAHLSCLDFLGDIPWRDWPEIHNWYARLKSRPSFRPLLADRIPGLRPPRHYTDLDF
jgi:glutathione S-transferase